MRASTKRSSPASATCRQRPVRPPRRVSADVKAPSRWGRHLVRSEGLRRLLCWVIQLYIRFVYRTNRWSVEGGDIPLRLRQQGQPFILAFWHGRLLMIPMAWQRLAPMHMLISAHRDGRIIADAVTYFGVNSIAGSTRRGGTPAPRGLLKPIAGGAGGGRLRRYHAGRAARSGDARQRGHCQCCAPRPRADRAGHLRDERTFGAEHLGPVSSRFAVWPRRVRLGRPDHGRTAAR